MKKPRRFELCLLAVICVCVFKDYSLTLSVLGEKKTKIRDSPVNNKTWWRGKLPEHQINETDFTSNGARHPNGTLGMIVDPSSQRLHLPPEDPTKNPLFCPPYNNNNNLSTQEEGNSSSSLQQTAVGFEGLGSNLVLQRIHKGILNSQAYLRNQTQTYDEEEGTHHDKNAGLRGTRKNRTAEINSSQTRRRKRSRILCMVYTAHTPGKDNMNVRSQAETWGRQCDGFIAASNVTDHSIGAIDLVHNGPEEYGNIWQKVRSMLSYAYNHYLEEFDFFYLCGDDVYIAVDNMRAYFDGPEVLRLENGYRDKLSNPFRNPNDTKVLEWASTRPRPLIFGLPFPHKRYLVVCGGPGYSMNRAALRVFGEISLHTYLVGLRDPREDIFVGSAFLNEHIALSDTSDANNAPRYGAAANLLYKSGIESGSGIEYGSEQYIAFHLKDMRQELIEKNRTIPELMHRYHAILNGLCKN